MDQGDGGSGPMDQGTEVVGQGEDECRVESAHVGRIRPGQGRINVIPSKKNERKDKK